MTTTTTALPPPPSLKETEKNRQSKLSRATWVVLDKHLCVADAPEQKKNVNILMRTAKRKAHPSALVSWEPIIYNVLSPPESAPLCSEVLIGHCKTFANGLLSEEYVYELSRWV